MNICRLLIIDASTSKLYNIKKYSRKKYSRKRVKRSEGTKELFISKGIWNYDDFLEHGQTADGIGNPTAQKRGHMGGEFHSSSAE